MSDESLGRPAAENQQANAVAGGVARPQDPPRHREPGLFIPRNVLLGGAIIAVAVTAGTLAWLAPAVGMPVGVAVAVAGLLKSVIDSRRGRGRS